MTITWSSLHRLLGVAPGAMTYELIERAVAEQLAEADDLDWKQAPPFKAEQDHAEKVKDELCKDVAAMANSGGGLIVYGVAEDRQTGRAQKITPVTMAEKAQQQIRSLAATRIRPIISNLQVVPLPAPDDASSGLLAVHVPASPSAPHGLEDQGTFRFPYRYGPQTLWMREPELERAYGERFARQVSEREQLATLVSEVTDRLDFGVGAWLLGVARPRVPRTGLVADTPREEVRSIVDRARALSNEIVPRGGFFKYGFVDAIEHESLNPRRGLRRWVVRNNPPPGGNDQSQGVHVEIHHDGTSVLAAQLNWNAPPTDSVLVVSELIESAATDLVALADATSKARHVHTPLALRLDLIPDPTSPLLFRAATTYGPGGYPIDTPRPIDGAWTLRRFTPLETELPATADTEALTDAACDLATDAMHQFGAESIRLLRRRSSAVQSE